MLPVTVFSGTRFWLVTALSILAVVGLKQWAPLSTRGRIVGFVLTQATLLIAGLGFPLLSLLALALLCGFLYAMATGKNHRRFFLASIAVMGGLLLFRHRIFLHTPTSHGPIMRTFPYLVVGFSYLALRCISFLIDRQAGKIQRSSFWLFMAYLFFAPAFVAGPIDRYGRFAADLLARVPITSEGALSSLTRIVIGLVKKVIGAGLLSRWALSSQETETLRALTTGQLWLSLYAYAWFLYFDFSGYSDLAIGTGQLFGITLPENFRWSYFRRNIVEFWNSWHITLTTWLRDYIFLPVGQRAFRISHLSNNPIAIAVLCYLVTMTFCGLWHGVASHFLIWGLYHGAGLSLFKMASLWLDRRAPPRFRSYWDGSRLGSWCSTMLTFHFVAIGWLFFIFDVPTAMTLLKRLSGGGL